MSLGRCRACGLTRPLSDCIRIVPVDPSARPFLVCRPSFDGSCFRDLVGPADHYRLELLETTTEHRRVA
jgi:hypothetical protein